MFLLFFLIIRRQPRSTRTATLFPYPTIFRSHYRIMVRELGLASDQVIFTGYQDDVRAYIAGFDVLAFPSVEPESFGRVLLEAMALQVPVITSAHGGAIEVVRDGQAGLWVPVGDVDEIDSAACRERVVSTFRSRV